MVDANRGTDLGALRKKGADLPRRIAVPELVQDARRAGPLKLAQRFAGLRKGQG